jgi:hypothetical protein
MAPQRELTAASRRRFEEFVARVRNPPPPRYILHKTTIGDEVGTLRFWHKEKWTLERRDGSIVTAQDADEKLIAAVLASIDPIELAAIRRRNRERQLREGMRLHIGSALRDRANTIVPTQHCRPFVAGRSVSRSPRRSSNVRSGSRRARAPARPSSSKDGPEPPRVARLPRRERA